jgi:predicted lipoprotein with Yx(FWY)xxD motif
METQKMRNRWLAGPGLAAVAVIALAACGSSGGGSASSGGSSAPAAGSSSAAAGGGSASTVVKTTSSSAGTVLTNSKGFTLYTFAADKGTTSTCYGQCAKFWPPLMGSATVAPGAKVSGSFGVTTRKDGSKQVTWNGHPLYTFLGDKKPGDVTGNGKNVDGGVWNVVTASGGAAPAPSSSSSSSSGGGSGGYGY